ncbi:MAG: hypothetical protein AB1451_13715 [Nitrospirota bacterium]
MSDVRHIPPPDAERRIWQWAELTSLSLELMEAAIRREHPALSDEEIRTKMVERLRAYRALRKPA